MFSMQYLSENPLVATFQLSSAASLNFGRSPNDVLGNGLNNRPIHEVTHDPLIFRKFYHSTKRFGELCRLISVDRVCVC